MSAAAELRSAFESCVLGDRSDLARLRATGPDFLDLLHRLSTADLRGLAPGEGRPTVLTSNKGRIVERLLVHHLGPDGVLAVAGAGNGPRIVEHLRRYTLGESTGLADIGGASRQWVLLGPRAAQALAAAGLEPPAPYGARAAEVAGRAVHVLGGDGLSAAGFSVVVEARAAESVGAALEQAVVQAGGSSARREVLEAFRVLRGIPAAGHELTEERNPLEAGLWDAVSFDKGCYVGQEVVARLRTYDKVSRALVGLDFCAVERLPEVGSDLLVEGRPVGTLTSVVRAPGRERPVGLGFVKRREQPSDGKVQVGAGEGAPPARIVELPFE